MELSVVQESGTRRSPNSERGAGGQEVVEWLSVNTGWQRGRRSYDQYLQHAAGLAFLAGFAGVSMIRVVTLVLATIVGFVADAWRTCCLHRAKLCGRSKPRNPVEGKGNAKQKADTEPSKCFHINAKVIGRRT